MCLRTQIRPSFPWLSERSCLIGSSPLWDQQRTKWQLSISPSVGRCIDLRSLTCFWNMMFLWSYQRFLCFSKCFLIQMIQNRYSRNNSSTSHLENWFFTFFVCFVLDNNWIDFWTTCQSPAGKTSLDRHQNQHQNTTYAGLAGAGACRFFRRASADSHTVLHCCSCRGCFKRILTGLHDYLMTHRDFIPFITGVTV